MGSTINDAPGARRRERVRQPARMLFVAATALALVAAPATTAGAAAPAAVTTTVASGVPSGVDTNAGLTTAAPVLEDDATGLLEESASLGAAFDPSEMPDGLDGTAMVPKRDVAAIKRQQAGISMSSAAKTPTARAGLVWNFKTSTSSIEAVGAGNRSYESNLRSSVSGFGVVDSKGVRMFRFKGSSKLWNHPVGQAQYILHNLNSYRLSKNKAYLTIAKANAQRLVDRRVTYGTGWYYPYDFDFGVHSSTTDILRAPWYSGMAQGQALSAFTRLYNATGDAQWKTAAARTFDTLRQAPNGKAPFAAWVDGGNRLWMEEYPRYPYTKSERVLNGQIYAIFGLHDYYQLTKNVVVKSIYLGALSTVERTAPTSFRHYGWYSNYCIYHHFPTYGYHKVHMGQFQVLWRMTHDVRWVSLATSYRGDFPYADIGGEMRVTPGRYTIYSMNEKTGAVRARRIVTFSRYSLAPFTGRARTSGGTMVIQAAKGAYAGWWFPQGTSKAYALGAADQHLYTPRLSLRLAAGTYSAYKLNASGFVSSSKTIRISRSATISASNSGIVQGRAAYFVRSGSFNGYWLPMQPRVTLSE